MKRSDFGFLWTRGTWDWIIEQLWFVKKWIKGLFYCFMEYAAYGKLWWAKWRHLKRAFLSSTPMILNKINPLWVMRIFWPYNWSWLLFMYRIIELRRWREKSSKIVQHSFSRESTHLHCNGNSVYIFLFWELRGLSPNFHIHGSVSDLYIPRIGPHISSSRKGRPIVGIYNSLTDTWMWKLGLRPRYSFSGNIWFKFSAFCLCSV